MRSKQDYKTYHQKLSAIKYLVRNNVYGDEWSGAGMYEIIAELLENKTKLRFSKKYLDDLLAKAEKR